MSATVHTSRKFTGESKNCYIKDVHYGASNALDDGFTVTKGALASLEITVSSRSARVQGAVADADGLPASSVQVVLVPEESRRTLHRLYKTETTDQYGHFEISGIAPGDYRLFSWEEVEQEPETVRGERREDQRARRRPEDAQPNRDTHEEPGVSKTLSVTTAGQTYDSLVS
jgi:hypothetical protein